MFLISVNLGTADAIAALYLLSLSFFNLYYAGNFGIEADHWRHSWRCYFLEFTFFASSEASLSFTTFLSVHLAINIPAIVKKELSKNKTILKIAAVWSFVILISLARQGIVLNFEMDPYNYFCLPFLTTSHEKTISICLHVFLLFLNLALISVTVACYTFLFHHTIKAKSNKHLQNIRKRKAVLKKFAARMAVLIITTMLTWIPVLCVQCMTLLNYELPSNTLLWVVFSSISVNLIFDPILISMCIIV